MTNPNRLRRLKPLHLQIIRLYWNGFEQVDISAILGCHVNLVSMVINSESGNQILEELREHTLDTMLDVRAEAQAAAPAALHEKIRLMTDAKDERVRNIACSDVLAIAGHHPTLKVTVDRPDPIMQKYANLSEDQIRSMVLQELEGTPAELPPAEPEDTLH